jgi:hypothetical protein
VTDFEAVKAAILIGLAIFYFLTKGLDDDDGNNEDAADDPIGAHRRHIDQ